MHPGMSRKELEKLCSTLEQTDCAAFIGEVWLKGWKKSTHSALPEITVNVGCDQEVEAFEAATVKKGKVAGQRYKVLFFEIADDEEIETPVKLKGGPLSKEAAGLCKREDFQGWVSFKPAGGEFLYTRCESAAADYVRYHCGVDSRAELDHDDEAARKFGELKRSFLDR